jgi:hypothetical protein
MSGPNTSNETEQAAETETGDVLERESDSGDDEYEPV